MRRRRAVDRLREITAGTKTVSPSVRSVDDNIRASQVVGINKSVR